MQNKKNPHFLKFPKVTYSSRLMYYKYPSESNLISRRNNFRNLFTSFYKRCVESHMKHLARMYNFNVPKKRFLWHKYFVFACNISCYWQFYECIYNETTKGKTNIENHLNIVDRWCASMKKGCEFANRLNPTTVASKNENLNSENPVLKLIFKHRAQASWSSVRSKSKLSLRKLLMKLSNISNEEIIKDTSLNTKISVPATPNVSRIFLRNANHHMMKRHAEIIPEEYFESNISTSTENITDLEATNVSEVFILQNKTKHMNPYRRRGEEGIIYIHGLFEMSGGSCRINPQTGPFEYKAAQLAIKHINDKKIIDGYQLRMYHNDTQCDSGVAVDAFFHSLYRQPTMSVILGTGSSEVTERLARVVSRWNVIQ
ncbi:uncharacterized protein LOC118205657, partial [Stegodyphus dumicola]|uniref:uncharacterized protein LOC118205657 n=1 Tax=Stegodyphus dumicola TaxID=202533 RepID=UPI0015B112F2